MIKKGLDPNTKTGQAHIEILKVLEQNPEGVRWTELARQVKKANPSIHPKTLNGCIWKLTGTFPDKVHKPSKGVFKLIR